jgi:hypothetical protein
VENLNRDRNIFTKIGVHFYSTELEKMTPGNEEEKPRVSKQRNVNAEHVDGNWFCVVRDS